MNLNIGQEAAPVHLPPPLSLPEPLGFVDDAEKNVAQTAARSIVRELILAAALTSPAWIVIFFLTPREEA